jgi:hypothetical protein
VKSYGSLEDLLGDPTIQLVANLTNPRSRGLLVTGTGWTPADAAAEGRQLRLSARWSLHVNELALTISEGRQNEMRTTFEPMTPMPWAV